MPKSRIQDTRHREILFFFFKSLKILFIYSWETQREAETQAEGEAGSLWGAPCGTRSQTPGSWPELKADTQPRSHPGAWDSYLTHNLNKREREREILCASYTNRWLSPDKVLKIVWTITEFLNFIWKLSRSQGLFAPRPYFVHWWATSGKGTGMDWY